MPGVLKQGKAIGVAVMLAAAVFVPCLLSAANPFETKFDPLKQASADDWSTDGENIFIRGNVHLPYGEFEIFADQAVINIAGKDIEATGNLRFYRHFTVKGNVGIDRLLKLETMKNVMVSVTGVTSDIWGVREATIKASGLGDHITADRLAGNLDTGYFMLENARLQFKTFVCKAARAERKPSGVIEVTNAEISSCEYLASDNGHYSIACGTATLTPHATEFYTIDDLDTDPGDHSVLIYNGFLKIYGIPLLWLPAFYKPKDESPGLFSIQYEHSSSWGDAILLSKKFVFTDYPRSSVKLHADYYTKRGFGYGADAEFVTQESRTEISAYGIYDKDQYETNDYRKYRIKIPHARYNFRISNVTHITPRLDFRGVLDMSSDPYVMRDFFSRRYNADPQPATYAALEQQFDHFSAALYMRIQANSFYTTAQRLPSFKLTVPRQELLNSNLYYQGDFSAEYLMMNWIDFDRQVGEYVRRKFPKGYFNNRQLSNYESFRMDTTHFFYYPLRLVDWLNIIPRAGFKMTAYSNSSDKKISADDLQQMFVAADPENIIPPLTPRYDNRGGSQFRVAGEFGFEANTKIYGAWQDVKQGWLGLDGLRHVIQPYTNYTFIPQPTVNRDHLFYFDDIDRIDKMHFFRIGVENRLQTRAGNNLRTILSMENFFDIHMEKQDDMGNLGDFCTILTATPFEGFSIRTSFAIDMDNHNGDIPDTMRNGRSAGKTGLNLKWLNRWNLSLKYSPAKDFDFFFTYGYRRPYKTRAVYSMGSTLSMIDAGGYFDRGYSKHDEQLTFGARIPLTPDRRTFGAYSMSYDFKRGYITEQALQLVRSFHCWELMVGFRYETDNTGDNNGKEHDFAFTVSAQLTGLSSDLQSGQNTFLAAMNKELRDSSTTPGRFGF